MEPCDECHGFFVFAGCSSVLESSTDSNDLFDLCDICVAVVDGVPHPGNGGEDGLVGVDVVSELDGMSSTSERWWCLNGGIKTWNCWGNVFLVGVIEFFGSGFVWVREVDAGDVCGSVFADSEEPCDALLDSGVLLRRAY